MGWDHIEGNWEQAKGKIREKWGKLTNDDLDAIHGQHDLLECRIHQRYGFATDHARKEVEDWFRWQGWGTPSFITTILTASCARPHWPAPRSDGARGEAQRI
jgi:uncharacterized protein YjbJ (UPF0337 family)